MSKLKNILPAERYTLQTGETVEVSPVTFGQLRHFINAIDKIRARLITVGINASDASTEQMFTYAFDEVANLMAIVLNKDRDWIDNLSIADGLSLLSLIIEQNLNRDDVKKSLMAVVEKMKGTLRNVSSILSAQDGRGAK